MEVSPPILVRIEWADSQGSVTASWLAAHFKFCGEIPPESILFGWRVRDRAETITTFWQTC